MRKRLTTPSATLEHIASIHGVLYQCPSVGVGAIIQVFDGKYMLSYHTTRVPRLHMLCSQLTDQHNTSQ